MEARSETVLLHQRHGHPDPRRKRRQLCGQLHERRLHLQDQIFLLLDQ